MSESFAKFRYINILLINFLSGFTAIYSLNEIFYGMEALKRLKIDNFGQSEFYTATESIS